MKIIKAAILHGAGYAGGELIRLLIQHPNVSLEVITSRSSAGLPVHAAHPALMGQTDLTFSESLEDPDAVDCVFIAAEHGKAAAIVNSLLEGGYGGSIVDLSTDFRFQDERVYPERFGFTHPRPDLIPAFKYGFSELNGPYPDATRFIANPGCFATGLAGAIYPLSHEFGAVSVSVTALTGASGSGQAPKPTTHFPTRDGNVRAYKILSHQHLPEVMQLMSPGTSIDFVPVSGPWTRGIWGTCHVRLESEVSEEAVEKAYRSHFDESGLVRLFPGELPELRFSVGTPFLDIGWVLHEGVLIVGFSLDNLLKGAASQAVQNMNLLFGLPGRQGLVPQGAPISEMS